MIGIAYKNADGEIVSSASHETEAQLCVETEYRSGDSLVFTCEPGAHLYVQPDAAIMAGEVYVPGGVMTWRVPCGAESAPYSPGVFVSGRHIVTARVMTDDEIHARRNIAKNPADLRGDVDFFPHITANVETRGEAIFAARNLIDGYRCNSGHWGWPYQSWGIGGCADACCTLDFGREVEIDGMAIVIRADFPHDAWWSEATVVFDGGETLTFPLRKTAERQTVTFGARRVRRIGLQDLKQDESSGVPGADRMGSVRARRLRLQAGVRDKNGKFI